MLKETLPDLYKLRNIKLIKWILTIWKVLWKNPRVFKQSLWIPDERSIRRSYFELQTLYWFFPTAEAHTFLGWTYSFTGDLDKAIEECKNAISVDADYGNPYNDIGSYLIKQGKHDEALTWLELAVKSKRYENHHFAHLNIGRVLELKGLWFEALEEYRTAIILSPDYLLAKQYFNKLQGLLN